jgi:RNA polymerase sigma-70 factor (ECF subfamily)
MSPQTGPPSSWNAKGQFAATRWSVVLAAAKDRSGTHTRRALEELIQAYWFPVYAYIRRQGQGPQQAEDLTQEFFTRLLEKKHLASVDQSKGRFRSFLLTAVKRFLVNQWDKSQAQKRGGGKRFIALDALAAEARYSVEPVDELTPERLFDRRWALAVLDQVLNRLRQEYTDRGKANLFESLQSSLADGPDGGYARIAREMGMSEGAVKVAAHRLRRRYRQLLREEIAQTMAGPEEIEAEIRHLMECL